MIPEENLGDDYIRGKERAPKKRMRPLARALNRSHVRRSALAWSWDYRAYILGPANPKLIDLVFDLSGVHALTVRGYAIRKLPLGLDMVTIVFWNAPR